MWFFKPKLKPKFFLLNWAPAAAAAEAAAALPAGPRPDSVHLVVVVDVVLFDEEQVHPGQGQPAGGDHGLDHAVRRVVARLQAARHRPAHWHLPAHAG